MIKLILIASFCIGVAGCKNPFVSDKKDTIVHAFSMKVIKDTSIDIFKPLPKTLTHDISQIGKKYVRQTNHMDSSFKFGDTHKWNTNKEYADSIEVELDRQVKLDSAEEISYRLKYHFKDYYYMWSYVDGSSNGWGENTITLDHKPSEKEIRNIVWNDFFNDRERVYDLLQIDISESNDNPNSLQNMSGSEKGQLQYQRVTHVN